MTINNPDSYIRNLWDWSILNGCLGDLVIEPLDIQEHLRLLWDWGFLDGCFGETRIEPMDIDGAVERKGRILFLETKEPGVPLKKGQRITYEALARKAGQTVFVIWGHPQKPEAIQVYSESRRSRRFPCDLNTLRAWVSRWFSQANLNSDINIEEQYLDDEP